MNCLMCNYLFQLDSARIAASRMSPMMETVNYVSNLSYRLYSYLKSATNVSILLKCVFTITHRSNMSSITFLKHVQSFSLLKK